MLARLRFSRSHLRVRSREPSFWNFGHQKFARHNLLHDPIGSYARNGTIIADA
jgi:hypothetical protein